MISLLLYTAVMTETMIADAALIRPQMIAVSNVLPSYSADVAIYRTIRLMLVVAALDPLFLTLTTA